MNDIHQNLVGAKSKNSARTQSRNNCQDSCLFECGQHLIQSAVLEDHPYPTV